MPQTAAKHSLAHFFQAWGLSQSKISTEFLKTLSLAAQRCRVCKQLQLAYRHWMARRGANYRCCSLLGREKERVLIPGKEDTSSGLRGNSLLTFWDFTHFFLQARTLISAILYGLYHHVPNCQYLSALFHLDSRSNDSSGKDIFITMPNRKMGYRAQKLSVYIKFWTLYKGKCLLWDMCQSTMDWNILEIVIVCTKTCAIYICFFCRYMYIWICLFKYYIEVTLKCLYR